MDYSNISYSIVISSSDVVVKLSTTSCCLSIFGAFAIFGTYIYIPEIRNTTRKLVLCLTVADFLTAAGYLISSIAYFNNTEESVCEVQSFITTYSSLVSFFLTVAVEIHICVSVVTGGNRTSSRRFVFVVNLICWLVPASIVIAAQVKDKLGPTNSSVDTGPWCWIKDDPDARVWRYITGKGWEFQCYLYTISLYILLKFYIYLKHRNRSLSDLNSNLREDDRNILYVWFVLYILRVWGSVRFIISDLGKDKEGAGMHVSKILMNLQAIGDPGQAFGNFILVCVLDNTVRSKFRELCHASLVSRSLSSQNLEIPHHTLQTRDDSERADQSIHDSANSRNGNGSMLQHAKKSNEYERLSDSDESSSIGTLGNSTTVQKD